MITIYHNPTCGTSRKTLALLEENVAKLEIIDYFKHRLTVGKLTKLLQQMNMPARELLRTKGKKYDELELSKPEWDDASLIHFMIEYPELMNRPIVVSPKGAKLCRPVETVLEIL